MSQPRKWAILRGFWTGNLINSTENESKENISSCNIFYRCFLLGTRCFEVSYNTCTLDWRLITRQMALQWYISDHSNLLCIWGCRPTCKDGTPDLSLSADSAILSDIGYKGKSKRVTNNEINMTIRGLIQFYASTCYLTCTRSPKAEIILTNQPTSGYTGGEKERSDTTESLSMLGLNSLSWLLGLQVCSITLTLATVIMKTVKNLLGNLVLECPTLMSAGWLRNNFFHRSGDKIWDQWTNICPIGSTKWPYTTKTVSRMLYK